MAIVEAKKMIAICNYGGWFELNEDKSIACFGWESHAADVLENMQLIDFKKEVAQTVDSSVDGLVVKYFLPGSNKKHLISVLNDDGFNKMKTDYKDYEQLEVFIIQEPSPVDTNRPQQRPAETQAALNSPRNEVIEKEADNGTTPLPNSTRHEPHVAAKQWMNLITGVGQRFNSIAELRETFRKYAIAQRFNYKYKKNERRRFTVKCKSENCKWRLHASGISKSTDVLCIKTMTATHTCQGDSVTTALRAKGSLIGEVLMERVKDNPKIKPKEFAAKLKSEYGIEANYSKARRAREYARKQLLGSYNEECRELAYKCEKITEVNPGSVAKFSTHEGLRLFVAFNASVSGFIKGCRPLLFLDSTPFSSRMLLTATSADGNDEVFPVVFAVVDEENDDNWRWFLTELKSLVSGHGLIAFVTKGLHEPLGETFGSDCFVWSEYYHLNADFAQTFYSFVSKANKLSITQLVDKLRDVMMRLIYTRATESSQWVTRLTPSMEERLKEEILQARSVQAFPAHEGKHEVCVGERVEIVDSVIYDCTCKPWLLTGVPCCHALAVMDLYRHNPYDYCSTYVNVETYHSAYEEPINPIPGLESISDAELGDGTALVTQPTGRTHARVKKRKVETGRVVPADFLKRPLQCGRCKGLGHNKRSCKEEQVCDQSATVSGRG